MGASRSPHPCREIYRTKRMVYPMKSVKLRDVEIGSGRPKVIVPIVAKTADDIVEKAHSLRREDIDLIEWRVDFYEDALDTAKVVSLLKRLREEVGSTPIIFTFRTKKEGGQLDISPEQYAELNVSVARSGDADAIDVEIFAGDDIAKPIIDAIHDAGCRVIGSNHDFGGTPPKDEMIRRMKKMQELGADIPKIAVMPKSPADVIALLDATQEMAFHHADRPILTMSMGHGVISRLAGEYFGSSMTFGAVGEVSAPGQIPVDKLHLVLDVIHDALSRS